MVKTFKGAQTAREGVIAGTLPEWHELEIFGELFNGADVPGGLTDRRARSQGYTHFS